MVPAYLKYIFLKSDITLSPMSPCLKFDTVASLKGLSAKGEKHFSLLSLSSTSDGIHRSSFPLVVSEKQ